MHDGRDPSAGLLDRLQVTQVGLNELGTRRQLDGTSPPVKQPQRHPLGGQIGRQPGADAPGGAREQQPHGRR